MTQQNETTPQAAHTPGTWEVNDQAGPNRTEVFSGDMLICDTLSGTVHRFEGTAGEPEANARLIAAAPSLLEAAKELLRLIDGVPTHLNPDPDETDRVFPRYEFDDIRAAVEKAEGK